MKPRRLQILLLGLLAAGALAASAAAATFHITEAGAVFPDRAYVLSLPNGMRLKPGDVDVRENGAAVNSPSVVPAGAPGSAVAPTPQTKAKDFGVVLVIDASISMRGDAQAGAINAARAFAEQRGAKQELGVVAFNNAATVVLPLTTDQAQIDAALEKPPALNNGTRIYDAVQTAVSMLKDKGIGAGSIVVLSDGADTGSNKSLGEVAQNARDAHIRVFSVGLRSRFFDKQPLQQFATLGGGRYSEANGAGDLAGIYSQLGSQLASEYLIRYRSLAGPGKRINVTVAVKGLRGRAGSAYETPKLEIVKAVGQPYHPSTGSRLWRSAGTMLVIVLLTAALIGVGVLSIVGQPREGRAVRRRMAEFVSVPSVQKMQRPTAQVTEKMLEGTEALFRGNSKWEKFKWELRVSGIDMPAEQIIMLTVLGTITVAFVVHFITSSLLVSAVFAIAVPFIVRWYLQRSLTRVRGKFAEQLPDNLQVLSSALRAGHSFVGALSVVVNDAPDPAKTEFSRVVADEQLGVPIEDALRVVAERMENRELEQVALVAALQRETGGNTAEVLDRVTDTIRERFELRRTVQTLTAQGRLSRWVLTMLPVALLAVITLINPGYIDILYSSIAGRILLVLAGISVTAGSMVIKRIVDIKV
jgi:tight adherence protein B